MESTPDNRLYLPKLAEYRADASKRRAAAFCEAPEYILGKEVTPLMPRTFSMLLATRNAFVTGAAPKEPDVRNYIWFHDRDYCHCGVRGWQDRKRRALRSITAQTSQPWRRWVGLKPDVTYYASVLIIASTEIRALVGDAFADAPAAHGRPGAPLATLEAQLIHEFAREYNWSPEQTRNTPLRQLFQLLRCVFASAGQEVHDRGEDKILEEHLLKRNAALAAERAAAKGVAA